MMPIEMPSYGERTASTRPLVYLPVRMSSMRRWAVAPSQRSVVTWVSSFWPDLITSCFLSM
nr:MULTISPECIES: hypothetical protein [Streptomyces]